MEELDTRQREVLRLIILEHIATGEPVSSSALAGRELPLSSATVRGVMADLEDLELLEKPHTSAGRIPTGQGYRYYVDTLIQLNPPSLCEQKLIEQSIPSQADAETALRETTRLLSGISHYASVITIPSLWQTPLEKIEFVQLKENRVLAIIISRTGLIRNLLLFDFPIANEHLSQAAAKLNELLTDAPLEAVRNRILEELARDRNEYDALERKTLALGLRVLEAAHPGQMDVFIQGKESFFEAPEFADIQRMRELFAALEEKSKLLDVLDRTLGGREVKIFIGQETEFSARTGASVVAAPYANQTGVIGSLGIIGPTRMNYSRAIALVDYTARVVTRLLQGST